MTKEQSKVTIADIIEDAKLLLKRLKDRCDESDWLMSRSDINFFEFAQDELPTIIEAIDRYDKALNFYADERAYNPKFSDGLTTFEGMGCGQIIVDNGKIAREALNAKEK